MSTRLELRSKMALMNGLSHPTGIKFISGLSVMEESCHMKKERKSKRELQGSSPLNDVLVERMQEMERTEMQTTLIILKALKLINWSWWAVFAPTLVTAGVFVIATIVAIILNHK